MKKGKKTLLFWVRVIYVISSPRKKVLWHVLILNDASGSEAVQAELWPQKLFSSQLSLSVVKALTLMSVQHRKHQQSTYSLAAPVSLNTE